MNLYAYAGGNPVAFRDRFGLDTVHVSGEHARRTVQRKLEEDTVFAALYAALDAAAEHYDILGTELVPTSNLNEWHYGGGFSAVTLSSNDAQWVGYADFAPFRHQRSAGTVILGAASKDPGNYAGHELVHLHQLKDGVGISRATNALSKYHRLFE